MIVKTEGYVSKLVEFCNFYGVTLGLSANEMSRWIANAYAALRTLPDGTFQEFNPLNGEVTFSFIDHVLLKIGNVNNLIRAPTQAEQEFLGMVRDLRTDFVLLGPTTDVFELGHGVLRAVGVMLPARSTLIHAKAGLFDELKLQYVTLAGIMLAMALLEGEPQIDTRRTEWLVVSDLVPDLD